MAVQGLTVRNMPLSTLIDNEALSIASNALCFVCFKAYWKNIPVNTDVANAASRAAEMR